MDSICLSCFESGVNDCENCSLSNPCIGCLDYDTTTHICLSNGGCGSDIAALCIYEEE